MNKYNVAILNNAGRAEFVSSVVSCTGKKYVDQTVRAAIKELVDNQLLISMSDKGKRESQYMVNPMFFWKTSKQGDRMEAIKAFNYKIEQNEAN
jgi:hypothetical protein